MNNQMLDDDCPLNQRNTAIDQVGGNLHSLWFLSCLKNRVVLRGYELMLPMRHQSSSRSEI